MYRCIIQFEWSVNEDNSNVCMCARAMPGGDQRHIRIKIVTLTKTKNENKINMITKWMHTAHNARIAFINIKTQFVHTHGGQSHTPFLYRFLPICYFFVSVSLTHAVLYVERDQKTCSNDLHFIDILLIIIIIV